MQGLIDQYVQKEQKEAEKANQVTEDGVTAPDKLIKAGDNSKTKKDVGKKSAALFISPKNITFKNSLSLNQNGETKNEVS